MFYKIGGIYMYVYEYTFRGRGSLLLAKPPPDVAAGPAREHSRAIHASRWLPEVTFTRRFSPGLRLVSVATDGLQINPHRIHKVLRT
jgi:hypothetical protein